MSLDRRIKEFTGSNDASGELKRLPREVRASLAVIEVRPAPMAFDCVWDQALRPKPLRPQLSAIITAISYSYSYSYSYNAITATVNGL
eukprot:scaffold200708_cov32-Tisochrysis_lutea.AAC.4